MHRLMACTAALSLASLLGAQTPRPAEEGDRKAEVRAAETQRSEGDRRGRAGKAQRRALRARVLEKYDANGNGTLDPDERRALRKNTRGKQKNRRCDGSKQARRSRGTAGLPAS